MSTLYDLPVIPADRDSQRTELSARLADIAARVAVLDPRGLNELHLLLDVVESRPWAYAESAG